MHSTRAGGVGGSRQCSSSSRAASSGGRGQRLVADADPAGAVELHDHVPLAPEVVVGHRIVVAGVAAPALGALEGGAGDRLGHQEHVVRSRARCQPGLYCRSPSTVTLATLVRRSATFSRAALQLRLGADDADQILHDVLQDLLQAYGFSPPSGLKRSQSLLGGGVHIRGGHGGPGGREPGGVAGRVFAGPAAEDQQVAQRVATQAVGAVHAACHLARRVEAGDGRLALSGSTSTPPMT